MEDVVGLSLQPIMFLLLFTYVFGGAIVGSTHGYLQYALPGLLVMTVVFATLGTGLMLNQDITGGVFDRFRTLPIARWAPPTRSAVPSTTAASTPRGPRTPPGRRRARPGSRPRTSGAAGLATKRPSRSRKTPSGLRRALSRFRAGRAQVRRR